MPQVLLKLKFEKETKHTYRFKNVDPEGKVIETVYVEKEAFSSKPSELTITLGSDALKG